MKRKSDVSKADYIIKKEIYKIRMTLHHKTEILMV